MLKNFLQKSKCNHEFVFNNISETENKSDILTNYNFKCCKCNEEKTLTNFEIINETKEIFLEYINQQLSIASEYRVSHSELKKLVWFVFCNNHSIDTNFEDVFPHNLIQLTGKQLSEITEVDILNLNIMAYGALIESDIDGDTINENGNFLIYKKFNNQYSYIERSLINFSVDKKTSILKEEYLNKGIHKYMREINQEALKSVCKELCIQYKEAI